jgi:hypothetical protein
MRTIVVLSSVALCACAMSSGVLKMGPDTYTLTVAASPVRGGVVGAKQLALEEASKYCSAAGEEILVTNTSGETTNARGAGSMDITFRCLAAGDPDLQRPDYRVPATTVIEDRRTR